MGLEVATRIDQLVVTNPVGATDPKSQGDDHLRLIKTAIKGTFPNFTGVLDSTDSAIDSVVTLITGLSTIAVNRSTPGISGSINYTSASSTLIYLRVGSYVFAVGRFVGAVAGAGNVGFDFSLPIASNLGAASDLFGGGIYATPGIPANASVIVQADTVNDTAQVLFTSAGVIAAAESHIYIAYEIK